MNRDTLISRLRDQVREWDGITGYRLRRLARIPEFYPLPPALTAWSLDYSAPDPSGKKWIPQYLQVSRVTTGVGRSLVSAIEDLQLEGGITIVEIWVGGRLYRASLRSTSSFGARWIQGSVRIDLTIPA